MNIKTLSQFLEAANEVKTLYGQEMPLMVGAYKSDEGYEYVIVAAGMLFKGGSPEFCIEEMKAHLLKQKDLEITSPADYSQPELPLETKD